MMIDPETNLEIGDPGELQFKDELSMDFLKRLQENVEKRLKYTTASPSGIRQIFDNTHGDEATDYVDGTGTEITNAAKIHVATMADCFVELLRKQTGRQQTTVVVAIDTRHTGPAVADIVIRALVFHKVDIRYIFIAPITEIAVYSREVSDGFVYISSSHNPRGYNGLKLGLNDGRLLPVPIALQFIEYYQARLRDPKNTEAVIHRINSVKPGSVMEVYNGIDGFRKEAQSIYARFSDQIITGLKNPHEVAERKESLKQHIQRLNLWIGIDPNGGARKDKEYLEGWGFRVLEINSRPRLGMVHELAPITTACEQAREALAKAQKEGKNIVAFLVFDTDGDRKNVVFPDGKGGSVIPGVQMVFTLDVLCSILDTSGQRSELGVVVNDPTTSVIDQLAPYLGFIVKRVEVGEANVATAGKLLHHQGTHVPIMGEGSNGSVFNLDLMVREPLHTVRTIINFITRPELTKMLLRRLHQTNFGKVRSNTLANAGVKLFQSLTNFGKVRSNTLANAGVKLIRSLTNLESKYDNWHSPDNVASLFMNIINALPPSSTTDFFTDEGIRRSGFNLPQELFRANFDAYFESELWPQIAEELRNSFGGNPVAEFINYEGQEELHGKGNRKTSTGGYKIEFSVQMQNGDKRHIGWLWFRLSGTERGIMRRGVSVSHWEITQEARKIVEKTYEYIDKMFNDALDAVEKKTLSGL